MRPRGGEAGVVHLGDFPNGGAGFGAAGLTDWRMTIRTGVAQQVGDAAVAGRMLGSLLRAELTQVARGSPTR